MPKLWEVKFKGNDGYVGKVDVTADTIEVAVQKAAEILGRYTIEQFVEVTAYQL